MSAPADPGAASKGRAVSAAEKAASASGNRLKAEVAERRAQASADFAAATEDLRFTKQFWETQAAIMDDVLATAFDRVSAWIYRFSWGEFALFCMGADGTPMYQVHCAKHLKLSKQTVSKTVVYLQARGYLQPHAKRLIPAIKPVLSVPKKGEKSREYEDFVEGWKVANSADFERLEVARSTVREIRKVIRSEYKKSQQQKTKASASLLETNRLQSEDQERAALSPLEQSNLRRSATPAKTDFDGGQQAKALLHARAFLFSEIARMQEVYKTTPFAAQRIDPQNLGDQATVNRMIEELGSTDEEDLVGFVILIAAHFKGFTGTGAKKKERSPDKSTGPQTLGLLVHWAADYGRKIGKTPGHEATGRALKGAYIK
jgi:hypothetical protein